MKTLLLRVASDLADERATADFAGVLKSYDGKGGQMVAEIVRGLPVDPTEPLAHDALRKLLEAEPGR